MEPVGDWEDNGWTEHVMGRQVKTSSWDAGAKVRYMQYMLICRWLVAHREMQLAEMGIALHTEGGALGVFSPKNVSVQHNGVF